ncbi:hypothetical protein EVAR_29302_1 [Eumeta japonica]|uniref:Uncharacterized protein n=1 Tax=Eumeta variegata TaxID=151549 RepID=A0A4C1VTQ6_EUMVA|nr:hypothetical protein EVAR_29302_1 [Eumeta japonica]
MAFSNRKRVCELLRSRWSSPPTNTRNSQPETSHQFVAVLLGRNRISDREVLKMGKEEKLGGGSEQGRPKNLKCSRGRKVITSETRCVGGLLSNAKRDPKNLINAAGPAPGHGLVAHAG